MIPSKNFLNRIYNLKSKIIIMSYTREQIEATVKSKGYVW